MRDLLWRHSTEMVRSLAVRDILQSTKVWRTAECEFIGTDKQRHTHTNKHRFSHTKWIKKVGHKRTHSRGNTGILQRRSVRRQLSASW